MNAAHAHLLLNHLPVLGGLAVIALLALTAFRENEMISKLTLQLMILIGILTLPAYFTGEPAEEVVEHLPGVAESFIDAHEKYALFSLISTELLAVIGILGLYKMKKNPKLNSSFWNLIRVVALVNVGLMSVTANFGGEIRHTEIRKDATSLQVNDKNNPSATEKKDDD